MEIIRTGLDYRDHRHAGHRYFSVVSRRSDLRLIQRHARHVNPGARAVGDIDAVDLNFRVRVGAVIRGARSKAHRAVADVDAIGRHTWRHGEELLQPLTDWHGVKRVSRQIYRRRRCPQIDDRTRAGHRDSLFELANSHRRVRPRDEADAEPELIEHDGLETGQFEGDFVGAGRQLADAIVAIGLRNGGGLWNLECRTRDRDRHARYRGA